MTRTIDRGANPFAPIAKQRNQALATPRKGVYEKLEDRVVTMMSDDVQSNVINQAIAELRERLGGKTYKQEHFGYLAEIDAGLIDINIDIHN
jgi:hypothetical protein